MRYITVPGAPPLYYSALFKLFSHRITAEQYAALNAAIGGNWFPGTTAEVVNYPATAGLVSGFVATTANESVAIGQQMLHTEILNALATGRPVVVTGFSEGTLVVGLFRVLMRGVRGCSAVTTHGHVPGLDLHAETIVLHKIKRSVEDRPLRYGLHAHIIGGNGSSQISEGSTEPLYCGQ